MERWGIRKTETGYEVWGRMLQLPVAAETELDAKTVYLACVSRYEGVDLRPEDVVVDNGKGVL